MPRFQSSFDGAELFFRDYIPSAVTAPYNSASQYGDKQQPAVVFLHQWPLSSAMWQPLMVQLTETHRLRCIAPDRRGFGQSDWNGLQSDRSEIDYDVFARDVVDLLEKIKVGKFIFVAASMAGGESILAYLSSDYVRRHCQGFVFTNTSLPYPVATPEFPQAVPREMWNQVIAAIRQDRVGFFADSFKGPLGIGNNEVPLITLQRFERMAEAADAIAVERAMQIFTHYDFSEKLAALGKESDVPILLLHGGADAGGLVEVSAGRVKQIIPRAKLIVYENASHILIITHAQRILSDVVDFVGSGSASAAQG
ncbi:Alpha/Beta hydrolase protein [Cadophora sp. MPI-SDFR-AT-0126]|nr:Alpha/Beta hydrolase protein [Leotiomycetes sp. MPI-SDFR-AT-0126]